MDANTIVLLATIAGLGIAVLALIFDEIRDRRSRRAKSPRWGAWRTKRWSLFDPSDPNRLQSDEGPIERPTVTRVAFWNAGFETILASDVSSTHPFRIVGRGNTAILDVHLIRRNGEGSLLSVGESVTGGRVIRFGYLRPGIGGVFAVSHSGQSERAIAMMGELISGKEQRRVRFPEYAFPALMPKPIRSRLGDVWSHRLFVLYTTCAGFLAIYLLFFSNYGLFPASRSGFLFWFLLSIQVISQSLVAFMLLRGLRVDVPKSLRPFDPSDAP